MKFEQALAAMREGKKAKRPWWGYYAISMENSNVAKSGKIVETVSLNKNVKICSVAGEQYTATSGDLTAEDWEIVDG